MSATQRSTGGPVPALLSVPPLVGKMSGNNEAQSGNRQSFRQLPTEFRSKGFDYGKFAREGNAAIYKQSSKGRIRSFEVVRIRRRDGFNIAGRAVEPTEVYPHPKSWGTDAWTFSDQQSAVAKFNEFARHLSDWRRASERPDAWHREFAGPAHLAAAAGSSDSTTFDPCSAIHSA